MFGKDVFLFKKVKMYFQPVENSVDPDQLVSLWVLILKEMIFHVGINARKPVFGECKQQQHFIEMLSVIPQKMCRHIECWYLSLAHRREMSR